MWNLKKLYKTGRYLMSTDAQGFGDHDNPDMNGQHIGSHS